MHASLLQVGNCSDVWPVLGCRAYLEMNDGGPVMLSLYRPPCACVCACICARSVRLHATLLQAGNCSGVWPVLGWKAYLRLKDAGL
jgi:hypothetical protein